MKGLIHYRILARHHDVPHCTITESISECERYRKFTATICGWRNFEIYRGVIGEHTYARVIAKVNEIRHRIESGDDTDFYKDCSITGGEL
jgi:hypothetical protein